MVKFFLAFTIFIIINDPAGEMLLLSQIPIATITNRTTVVR